MQDSFFGYFSGKGKGDVHPTSGYEGSEGRERYSYTLSLISALKGVGVQCHAPAALPRGKSPGTHCIGGWVAPGPVWTGAENLASTGIRSLDPSARSE